MVHLWFQSDGNACVDSVQVEFDFVKLSVFCRFYQGSWKIQLRLRGSNDIFFFLGGVSEVGDILYLYHFGSIPWW